MLKSGVAASLPLTGAGSRKMEGSVGLFRGSVAYEWGDFCYRGGMMLWERLREVRFLWKGLYL